MDGRYAIGVAVAIVATALGIYAASLPSGKVVGGTPFSRETTPKPLPVLIFQDATEQPRSLADFRGKLVVLNIWATWCAPCREEMPALDRLHTKLRVKDFEVLALSIDQQGTGQVRKFFTEAGIRNLSIYTDPTARAGFTLGALGIPTTLLVDQSGREVGRHTGIAKWDSPEIVGNLRHRLDAGRKPREQFADERP